MKYCACGALLVKRDNESPSRFAKRRACSLSCAGRLKKNQQHKITALMTCEQVAEKLGLSRSSVQQIEARALRKLRIWAEGWR